MRCSVEDKTCYQETESKNKNAQAPTDSNARRTQKFQHHEAKTVRCSAQDNASYRETETKNINARGTTEKNAQMR